MNVLYNYKTKLNVNKQFLIFKTKIKQVNLNVYPLGSIIIQSITISSWHQNTVIWLCISPGAYTQRKKTLHNIYFKKLFSINSVIILVEMLVLLASKYTNLGHIIIPSTVGSKEATKEYWGFVKGLSCQLEQLWLDNDEIIQATRMIIAAMDWKTSNMFKSIYKTKNQIVATGIC